MQRLPPRATPCASAGRTQTRDTRLQCDRYGPRRLRRERLARDPEDATPRERRQTVDRGLWWSLPWGQRVLRENRSRRDSQRHRAQKKGVGDKDTDCTRESATHTTSHLITRRVAHHARSVAQSVLCAMKVTGPRLCVVASQTLGLQHLSSFVALSVRRQCCRHSSLRRLLVSVLDDGENA